MRAAAAKLQQEHPGQPIQLVAHSIGGWIARAYLGQLSAERRAAFGALVTLGSLLSIGLVSMLGHAGGSAEAGGCF